MRQINNERYYNSTLAYDFKLFMPKAKTNPLKVVKQEESKIIKVNPKSRMGVKVFYLMFLICCILCIILSIFLKSRINETNSEIANTKSEIAKAQSEATALDCELKSIISYSNLECEATKIGMHQASKQQVHYIVVYKNDVAVINGREITSQKP